MFRSLLFLVLVTSLVSGKEIIIATGGKKGNYFKVGKDINKKVFKDKAKVINTYGSMDNMLLIANKKADIALVQADALVLLDLYFANKNKTFNDLVDIAGKIYTETLHLVVNKKSKIRNLSDLDGKIVSFGGMKSGNSVTATTVEQNNNIKFKAVLDINVLRALNLVDKNYLDALFYVTKTPSSLLQEFKNIRFLSIKSDIPKNVPLRKIQIPKKDYLFLKAPLNTYGVDTLVILQKGSQHTTKIKNYLRTIKTADLNVKFAAKKKDHSSKQSSFIKIDQNIIKKYSNRYGNPALVRLNYISKKMLDLKSDKLVKQLKTVDKLVNRLKYLPDERLWKKDDYWATPLETIGTGYTDTEEVALLKLLFLTNLGVDNKKLKLIQKENKDFALAYFHKKSESAIIMEYGKKDKKTLYKYKDQFKYKIIKQSKNKTWAKAFRRNINIKNMNTIFNKWKQ